MKSYIYCITKPYAINFSKDTMAHMPLPNNLNLIYELLAFMLNGDK